MGGRGESYSVSIISGIGNFDVAGEYVTIFDFLSKFFCLTEPKIVVGEPFCAVFQKKILDKRGGSIKIFRPKFYNSQ